MGTGVGRGAALMMRTKRINLPHECVQVQEQRVEIFNQRCCRNRFGSLSLRAKWYASHFSRNGIAKIVQGSTLHPGMLACL